jgi:hypothetical protein
VVQMLLIAVWLVARGSGRGSQVICAGWSVAIRPASRAQGLESPYCHCRFAASYASHFTRPVARFEMCCIVFVFPRRNKHDIPPPLYSVDPPREVGTWKARMVSLIRPAGATEYRAFASPVASSPTPDEGVGAHEGSVHCASDRRVAECL